MSGSRWRRVLAGVVAFLVGTGFFSYGGVMTFMVPGEIGESLFSMDRLLFGILPLLTGIAILILAGWFLFRSNLFAKTSQRPRQIDVVAVCIVGAIGTIWLFFLIGSLLSQ